MLFKLNILLSMLALIEAIIIERDGGIELSLTSVGDNGVVTTTIVDNNGRVSELGNGNTNVSGTVLNADSQAISDSVASVLSMANAADAAMVNTMDMQATADAVAAAFALTESADEVAIMNSDNAALADSISQAFALANAAGAAAMGAAAPMQAATPDPPAANPPAANPPAANPPSTNPPAANPPAPIAASMLPDGRIKSTAKPADFDDPASPFKNNFVLGDGKSLSCIVKSYTDLTRYKIRRRCNISGFAISIASEWPWGQSLWDQS